MAFYRIFLLNVLTYIKTEPVRIRYLPQKYLYVFTKPAWPARELRLHFRQFFACPTRILLLKTMRVCHFLWLIEFNEISKRHCRK